MFISKFQQAVLRFIGINLGDEIYSADQYNLRARAAFDDGEMFGFTNGQSQAKVKFAVLPLPFTESQLKGREYGTFITPNGFGTAFGECNIPAPSQYGYEHRAYYVESDKLDLSPNSHDLVCHHARKFKNPAGSNKLVPVIVTVLR